MTPATERAGLLFGAAAALIWGGYLAVTRFAVGVGLHADDLAFLRYATAGLLMAPWFMRHRPLAAGGVGWPRGLLLAALAGPPFVLVGASGFLFAPLAHSAVIQLGTLTLTSFALSAGLLGEPVRGHRLAGVMTIVAGLAITAGPGLLGTGAETWKGDLLFALAGSMWALFTVLHRRWRIPAAPTTAVVSVLSGALYTPVYLAGAGARLLATDPWLLSALAVMLGGLAGVAALFAFSHAVHRLGSARASLFPALAPGIAILIGVPLTGETPSTLQLAGVAIVSVGLLLAVRKGRPPAASSSSTASASPQSTTSGRRRRSTRERVGM